MSKHGVLLGSLGTLALVIVLGLSFTWASAQEINVYLPFLGGGETQEEVSAANSADSEDSTVVGGDSPRETIENRPIQPFDNPRPGEIRPVPVDALPTAAPVTAEEKELREALEKMGPEETEIIIVAGPETKGQRTRILNVGWVDLPSDVWVDFHGTGLCTKESLESGDCITGMVTVIRRDSSEEELFLQNGLPLYTQEQNESNVKEAYADVLALIMNAQSSASQ